MTTWMPPPRPKISYEEFLERTDDNPHVEWVEGHSFPLHSVTAQHQDINDFLLALLRTYSEERVPGKILTRPFQMKAASCLPGRSPDLLFIAASHTYFLKEMYLDGPADLVVEIISPESRSRDRGDKFFEYEAAGIPEYWLLDPLREQAEFYQIGDNGIYRLVPADATGQYQSVMLPGLWLQVDWFWQTPLPSLLSVLKAWDLV